MIKNIKKFFKKNKKKIILTSLIIAVITVVTIVICLYVVPTINNTIRKDRIVTIFNSLKLDEDKYIITDESVFGEKRVYEWDNGRSYSSYKNYVRSANVDITVTELKKAITNAGFTYFEEPYPGSSFIQLHFKSKDNEYIRMTVSSKPYDDLFFNKFHMGIELSETDYAVDKNIGPSNVIIKVNMDDNNE